jgi:molybdenum cofactor biosynthesis enzyme MoaA
VYLQYIATLNFMLKKNYFKTRYKKEIFSTQFNTQPPFPKNALIELTNGCNHACVFCKNSHQIRKPTYLNLKTYLLFVKQAVELGLEEIGLYATGEPFMTKNIEDYISLAKKNGIKRIYLTTNGALASLSKVKSCVEAGLNSIKFSINASNSADYKIIHGKDDFDKVFANLEEIFNWKIDNRINLQILCSCVLVPSMPHTKEKHYKLFNKYFDDIWYGESYSQGGQKFDIPLNESELKKFFTSSNTVDEKNLKPCSMVFNRYHLTAEGYLTACCVDYNLNLVYSDINKEILSKSWLNKIINKLRQQHLDKKLNNTICHACLTNKKKPYEPISNVYYNKIPLKKFNFLQNKLLERFK